MIDIHHHLIWGVDDGAADRDVTIAMVNRAVAQGVTEIVCTSHTRPGQHELNIERYMRHMTWLQEYIRANGLDLRLHVGSELMYTTHAAARLKEGLVPTIDATWNVLVEFLPSIPHELLRRGLMDIMDAGFHPVLAHAERYQEIRQGDRLAQLKQSTRVLIQMNADTVLKTRGFMGDRWAKAMLKEGVIDLIGSDAHSAGHRPCRMGEAYDTLVDLVGEDRANDLCIHTPASLLNS